jgi:hypothetical protein
VCLGKHKRQEKCPGRPSHQAWIGEVEGREDGTMALVMDYVGCAHTVKSPRSMECEIDRYYETFGYTARKVSGETYPGQVEWNVG